MELKLQPFFHIDFHNLVTALVKETEYSRDTVEEHLCYWLNIDNPHIPRVTQIVYTCYDDLARYNTEIINKMIEIIQRDNVNVLGTQEIFCLEI